YDGWDVYYKVTALDHAGNESEAATAASVTGDDVPGVPEAYALYQNVPNPFNPVTTIRFDLPKAGQVRLDIYNVKGELVSTVVDGHMSEGHREVRWTGTNGQGMGVASGIYFYRLVAGDFVRTRKMVLLR
ncbi:MAG TPA: FlgD immunoglobulin-like domain containing protein, partial [Candidatus Krumholzibacterium sp.]|nr:FlgD immunoglobulin-like domain containing protein [Candidatus Krumholzibacterium sp.]